MRKNNSKNRSGLIGVIISALVVSSGLWSCFPDYNLDKEFPEWLGTSIYETLEDGFKDDTGKKYSFKYFVRLIDTLDQKSILSRTGSRTLFVADDSAFQRFLDKCPIAGGAKVKFEDLSKAQLKMILKGSMLNNVFQVASLSNTSTENGVRLGDCMRRVSTMSEYDTVRVLKQEDMPKTQYWDYVRNNPNRASSGIVILEDGTKKPMIFFAPEFLSSKKITDDDYNFLFNLGGYSKSGKPGRQSKDASVNGVRIEYQNKKCYNGFIHVMEDVVYLLPSMAEYLSQTDENGFSNSIIYSSIIERFSAPFIPNRNQAYDTDHIGTATAKKVRDLLNDDYYGPEGSVIADALGVGGKDSVFTKMYFSGRFQAAHQDKDTLAVDGKGRAFKRSSVLKFDPGWNSYFISSSAEDDVALQEDMAVMFVPTDSAMMRWWLQTALGQEMRTKYGTNKTKLTNDINQWTAQEVAEDMSEIDLNVIVKLINNNMFASFTSTVPSKFGDVMNDAQDAFFSDLSTAIDHFKVDYMDNPVVMCCNGAIYFSDMVFVPTAYKAVSYPALINDKLKVLNWAIEDQEMSFSYYLNSMQSGYSLFLPQVNFNDENETTQERLIWIDPSSFALNKLDPSDVDKDNNALYALAFYYDEVAKTVKADYYTYDAAKDSIGTKVNTSSITNETFLRNRLEDFMDYHIILLNNKNYDALESGEFEGADGFAYFRTKGGGAIRFNKSTFVDTKDPDQDISMLQVAGGWQIEQGQPIEFVKRFDMTASDGNGITYVINRPLQTSRKSVYDILSDSTNYPEFKEFFKLMKKAENSDGKGVFADRYGDLDISSKQCISSFNTYNYTVYVPQNDSIKRLLKDGIIYSPYDLNLWDSICKAAWWHIHDDVADNQKSAAWVDSLNIFYTTYLNKTVDPSDPVLIFANDDDDDYDSTAFKNDFINVKCDELVNFIKYHIQDNSVYTNAEFNQGTADYETAYLNKSKQFAKLRVNVGSDIYVTDAKGHVRKVQKVKNGLVPYWNIMSREYVFKKYSNDYSSTSSEELTNVPTSKLETSSYAVIHLIDGALCNGEVNF